MDICQYYKKTLSKYSEKVAMILFDNKTRNEWEWDNLIMREMKKKIKVKLLVNQMLKDKLKKKSILKNKKKTWLELAY
jgi:hypothetical protein